VLGARTPEFLRRAASAPAWSVGFERMASWEYVLPTLPGAHREDPATALRTLATERSLPAPGYLRPEVTLYRFRALQLIEREPFGEVPVFDMPRPLSNRFLHLEVSPDLDTFRAHAIARGLHERILAFLSYRPTLLHRMDPQRPAWPSPRSWEMADALLRADLDLAPAVGAPAAGEFDAFCKVYASLPDLPAILRGDDVPAPQENSARYATTLALALRADGEGAAHALRWVQRSLPAEWLQLFLLTATEQLRGKGALGPLAAAISRDRELAKVYASLDRTVRS
jgi:hypothetical protein